MATGISLGSKEITEAKRMMLLLTKVWKQAHAAGYGLDEPDTLELTQLIEKMHRLLYPGTGYE